MRKDDLLTLADHLRTVPTRGFDMKHWTRVIKDKVLGRKHVEDDYECGMSACLGGHAALLFPHRLKLVGDAGDFVGELRSVRINSDKDDYLYGDEAFAQAFDLCTRCAEKITWARALHQTPKRAATALGKLVRGLTFTKFEPRGIPAQCRFGVHNCTDLNARSPRDWNYLV